MFKKFYRRWAVFRHLPDQARRRRDVGGAGQGNLIFFCAGIRTLWPDK